MEGNRSQETEPLPKTRPPRPDDQAWQELQGFIAHVDRLARSSLSAADFYQAVLDQLTSTLAAIAGAVWLVDAEKSLQLGATCGVSAVGDDDWTFDVDLHRQLTTFVAQQGALHYLPPHAELSSHASNDSPHGIFFVPIVVNRETLAVIELIQRGGMSVAARRGHERLLGTLAEIAADFHQRLEVHRLRSFRRDAVTLLELVGETQAQASLKRVGDKVVAGAAKLLACDRVSLHVRRGRRLELLAISGADRFDPRSNALRTLRRLAQEFEKSCSSDTYQFSTAEESTTGDDPSMEWTLLRDEHFERTGATQIAILPLQATIGDQVHRDGLLICETFADDRPMRLDEELVAATIHHTALVLHPALVSDRFLLGRWQRRLAERPWFVNFRGLFRWLMLLGLVGTVILGLCCYQTEFYIQAQGELRPANTREIFAPADGEVTELLVQDGADVERNELLARLQSPTLDLQLQQVVGDYETARKRLEGITSARVRLAPTESNAATRLSQLSAEELELRELLGSKQRELELLRAHRESLALRSPLQGQVITWDAARHLLNRPVRRGQALLAVADTRGDWIVQLFIPQDGLAFLQEAQLDAANPLLVRFHLATAPDRVQQAEIVELSSQVEWNEQLQMHGVLAKARLVDASPDDVRPGSVVYGRIACGRKSLGYVWLHDLIERVRGEWHLAGWDDSGSTQQ